MAVGRLRKARYAIPAWTIDEVDPGTEIVAIGVAKDDVLESPAYESGVGLASATGSGSTPTTASAATSR